MRDGSLDLIESAVRHAGIRASLCYEVSDRNVMGGGVEENERFIKKIGKGDGQIAAMMGLHASFTLSDETLEKCVSIARENGVGCHVHVAEDLADRDDSLNKYGIPAVHRLDKMGASGAKSLFIHCVHIDESEMDIIAGTKTNVCVECTARDAMMLDYKVVVLSDCTAALSDDEHRATLENVIQQFGDVLAADEALCLLDAR